MKFFLFISLLYIIHTHSLNNKFILNSNSDTKIIENCANPCLSCQNTLYFLKFRGNADCRFNMCPGLCLSLSGNWNSGRNTPLNFFKEDKINICEACFRSNHCHINDCILEKTLVHNAITHAIEKFPMHYLNPNSRVFNLVNKKSEDYFFNMDFIFKNFEKIIKLLSGYDKIYTDSNKLKKFFKIIMKFLSQRSRLSLSEFNLGLDLDIDEELYPSWKEIIEHLRIYKNYYIGLKSQKINLNEEKIYLSTDILKEEDVIKNIIDFDNKVKLNLEKVHNITEIYKIKCNKNLEALNKMVAFVDVIHSHNISNIEKINYITKDTNYTHEHVLEVLSPKKLNNTVSQLEIKLQPEKISIQVAGKTINVNKKIEKVKLDNFKINSLIDYNFTHPLPDKISTPLDSHLTDHSLQVKLEDRNSIHSVTKELPHQGSSNSTIQSHILESNLSNRIETPNIRLLPFNKQLPLDNDKKDLRMDGNLIGKGSKENNLEEDDDMDMMDDDDDTGNLLMGKSNNNNVDLKLDNKSVKIEKLNKICTSVKIGEPSIGNNSKRNLAIITNTNNSSNKNFPIFSKNQISKPEKRIFEPSLGNKNQLQKVKTTEISSASLESGNSKQKQMNQEARGTQFSNLKNTGNNIQINLQNYRKNDKNNINILNNSNVQNKNSPLKTNQLINQREKVNINNKQIVQSNPIHDLKLNKNSQVLLPLTNNYSKIQVQTPAVTLTPSLPINVPQHINLNMMTPSDSRIQNLLNSNLPKISQAKPLVITPIKLKQTPDDFNKNVFKPDQKIENLVDNILKLDNKLKFNKTSVLPSVINPTNVNNLEKLLSDGKTNKLFSESHNIEKKGNLIKNTQTTQIPVSKPVSNPPLRKKEDDDDDMGEDEDDKAFLQKQASISLLDAELGIKKNEKVLNSEKITKLSIDEIKTSAKKFMLQLKNEIDVFKKESSNNDRIQQEKINSNSSSPKSSIFQEDNKSLKHLSETSANLVSILSNNLKSLDDEFFKVKNNLFSSLIK